MVNGSLVTEGWRAPEVAEALDLCLSCKACASECPTGTDVAAYKSRVLEEAHRHRLRPRSHYALGWLPTWGRAITAVPGLAALVNATLAAPGIGRAARWLAGVDQRRSLPRFASRRARTGLQPDGTGKPVVVWVDSFTDTMDAGRLEAVLAVLVAAGFAPSVLRRAACCGLPWITTGQRDHAARLLRHSLELLHPIVATGTPIVGLEPSCVAVWRSDAAELVDDPRVADLAAGIHTLAEVLATAADWEPPDLTGTVVVAQPHCHHSAVLGWGSRRSPAGADGCERCHRRGLLRPCRQLRRRDRALRDLGRGRQHPPAAGRRGRRAGRRPARRRLLLPPPAGRPGRPSRPHPRRTPADRPHPRHHSPQSGRFPGVVAGNCPPWRLGGERAAIDWTPLNNS